MNDKDIEQQIQAKGLTAPRVTPEHIRSIISHELYFTAQQGVYGEAVFHVTDLKDTPAYPVHKSLGLLTFCVMVLSNGFTVTGESACASPENFDPEIGRKIARENAVNKIWMLEGYLLKQRLHDDRSDIRENKDDCKRSLDNATQGVPVLTQDQLEYVFRAKANLLGELMLQQQTTKQEAEALAETVNAAFSKLTA